MMLCFRAKTKVRYAIVFCLFATLVVYAIARLAGCCTSLVSTTLHDNAKPEMIRRSYTSKWHDSRELLNDMSETQKLSHVRAKFLRHLVEKAGKLKTVEQDELLNKEKFEQEIKANEDEIAENIDGEEVELVEELDNGDAAENNDEDEAEVVKGLENDEAVDMFNPQNADVEEKESLKPQHQSRHEDLTRQIQEQYGSLKGREGRDKVPEGAVMDFNRDSEHVVPEPDRNRQEVASAERRNKNTMKAREEDIDEVKRDYDQKRKQLQNHEGMKLKDAEPENYQQNFHAQKDSNYAKYATKGEVSVKVASKVQRSVAFDYGKMQRSNRTIFDPHDSEIKYQVLPHSQSFTRSLINKSRISEARMKSDFPMTPDEAIARYKDQLPPWEQFEIFHYPKIYYLGLRANKTKLTTNETNNFGFDYETGSEDEGHYKVVEGDHVGYRYEILKFLGSGTFGSVVLARDWSNPSARNVALKIMHYDEDLKYIVREMKMNKYIEANASNRDYFPHMLATFQFRNHYCMVLELLGHSIDRHYIGAVRNMSTFRRYATDIMTGMKYLKQLNIVHGDLKPDNIMFLYGKNNKSEGQLLKVADFGISCIPGSKAFKCPAYYMQTRYYRAPEVILSLEIAPYVDMFSVGVILAELYLGVPPFFGETEPDQLAAMMEVLGLPPTFMIAKSKRKKIYAKAMCYETENGFHRKPYRKPLTKVLKGMDEALFDLIARCLEYDPKYRITPQEALNHPFITGKYPPKGFIKPLSIERLEGNT